MSTLACEIYVYKQVSVTVSQTYIKVILILYKIQFSNAWDSSFKNVQVWLLQGQLLYEQSAKKSTQ